ncbi:MAG TPA: PRC-barrel domain-containing protein, partial [Stellaceae bacterium]|nr:PRC-barrel domain-containing protein [Stellaceae bacterium]
MKRPALVALILFAAGPVWAQSSSDKNPPTEPSATTTPPAAPPAAQSPPPPATAPPATTTSIPAKQAPPPPNLETLTAVEARDILGQEVSDASGNDMGLVVDVLFDEKKEPRAVVIDFGGFLG